MAENTDITKTGGLTYKQLQEANNLDKNSYSSINLRPGRTGVFQQIYEGPEQSPLMQQTTRLGQQDYLGNSVWDVKNPTSDQLERLGDIRAENQPWYSQLVNGPIKGAVLAATTALEGAGLLYGLGQGIYNAVTAEDGKGLEAFGKGLWDNDITRALKTINDAAEEYLPNYYTREQQENPLSLNSIFSINTLSDGLIKNFGFMVGAFYGGIPYSKLIGAAGVRAAKAARAAGAAERAGMARRVGELAAQYGDDAAGLAKALKAENLSEEAIKARTLATFDRVRDVAKATRFTSQAVGTALGALNEGAIEAINNSEDWAMGAKKEAQDAHDARLASDFALIESQYAGTEMEAPLKIQAREEADKELEFKLQEIERGKTAMGNADLLFNLPILWASNVYRLGKLYSRGFDSAKRELGVSGMMSMGTLRSDKSKAKGIISSLARVNTEGAEEFLQNTASTASGDAVQEAIDRAVIAGKGEHENAELSSYIVDFGKAFAKNLSDPQAWNEYMIGAVSALAGMPVFGSQTRNAYTGDNGVIGLAGGLVGEYRDYMNNMQRENQFAEYLNKRVKDPEFKTFYEALRTHKNYDKLLEEALEKDDKGDYKNKEAEQLFHDIHAAASLGRLEEFKALIGYNDYTDEELASIVENTSKKVTAKEQKDRDLKAKQALSLRIDLLKSMKAEVPESDKRIEEVEAQLQEVNDRLTKDNYKDTREGPFINASGAMNNQVDENGVVGGEMRKILQERQKYLMDAINTYQRVRNNIDIETNGALKDDELAVMTLLGTQMFDYNVRSTQMADDIVSKLPDIKQKHEELLKKEEDKLQDLKNKKEQASSNLQNAKEKKARKNTLTKLEKKLTEAEDALAAQEKAVKSLQNLATFLEPLLAEKNTSAIERAAYERGRGGNILEAVRAALTPERRAINSEELQNFLLNKNNLLALKHLIFESKLPYQTMNKLIGEADDLAILAQRKLAYDDKLREFTKDPERLRKAMQLPKDRINQEQRQAEIKKLSSRLRTDATTWADLDNILRGAENLDTELTKAALEDAKANGDEDTKKFIQEYEDGRNLYSNFMTSIPSAAAHAPKGINSEEVIAVINSAAHSAWENALSRNDTNPYNQFIENLEGVANDFEKNVENQGTPTNKAAATAIRQIFKDLKAAANFVSQKNKNVKPVSTNKSKSPSNNKDNKAGKDEEEEVNALAKAREARARKKAEEEKKNTPKDTKEGLLKEVRDAIQRSAENNYAVSSIDFLPEELQKRISIFNTENPDDAIEENGIIGIYQEIIDEEIESRKDTDDSDSSEIDDEVEEADSLSEKMKAELRGNFKSDHPTEFVASKGVHHKTPYRPSNKDTTPNKQLEAVQELLKEFKAYHFLDKNYLGYIFKDHPTIPIHFLKSTREDINNGQPITFLAIEAGENVTKAIKAYAFNGNTFTPQEAGIRLIKIGDKNYHLVGVLSFDAFAEEDVQQAFGRLQNALSAELNPQLETARNNGQEFVVSEKFTTTISGIFTGRLEKQNNENDTDIHKNKVSLWDFIHSGRDGVEGRESSTEWQNGYDFPFGIVGSDRQGLVIQEMPLFSDRDFKKPNEDRWQSKHRGAILMFIPKPDGKLYPVSCTRRTVKDWLAKKADENRTGEELLMDILEGKEKNAYLEKIIEQLKVLADPNSLLNQKIHAKYVLSRYLISFNKSGKVDKFPLSIDRTGKTVIKNILISPNADAQQFIHTFFKTLATTNTKFTVPIDLIQKVEDTNEDKSRENKEISRALVNSGILEVGLRGFYNFNANFIFQPIDETGKTIDKPAPAETTTPEPEITALSFTLDLGSGLKEYTVENGNVLHNGMPVSSEEANLVMMAQAAENGTMPLYLSGALVQAIPNKDSRQKATAQLSSQFSSLYTFNSNGEDWVYDSSASQPKDRLFKLSSDKGKALQKQFDEALQKVLGTDKPIDKRPSPARTDRPTAPVSRPRGKVTPATARFTGKTLKDFKRAKDGTLENYLFSNFKNLWATSILKALQSAEEQGKAINDKSIIEKIKQIQKNGNNNEEVKKVLQEIQEELQCR